MRHYRTARLLAVATTVVSLAGCSALPTLTLPVFPVPAAAPAATPTPWRPSPTATPTPTPRPTAAPGGAVATLAKIAIKGRAPKTGYTREQFGAAWSDVDRNGCDQRNDVLARDMTKETFKPGTRNCVVLTGTLADPYTGKTIAFTRGQGTSEAVQIDHVVALSDAWQKGAQKLTPDSRKRLGNDPLNLLAVDGPTNQSKGDGDAATWLPRTHRCSYVARQVEVKAKYGLWVTQAEHDAMAGVLAGCPGEQLPPDSTVPAR